MMVGQVRCIDWPLPQSKMTPTSWGGELPLSGPRNWLEITLIAVSLSSNPPQKEKLIRNKNFPARYWVALDQQNSTKPKKEFGSEIQLQDACSHEFRQLEKTERQVSKIEQFK